MYEITNVPREYNKQTYRLYASEIMFLYDCND